MGLRLLLGSASPRRRELLRRAGLDPRVEPADVDEELEVALAPWAAAEVVALRKAQALLERHRGEDLVVLCADTVVGVPVGQGWKLLGKPADRADARAMLGALQGTTQSVSTAVVAVRCNDGETLRDTETTAVTMRALTQREIDAYLDTDEWRDKAGGYGIQGRADAFVQKLEGGGFDNVVGLPVARALALLERLGYSPV